MTIVFLGIGTSINREHHVRVALHELEGLLEGLQSSTVYRSKAVGFDGEDFYNLVVCGNCDLSLAALRQTLKAIEERNGREEGTVKLAAKTLDIDILLYNNFAGIFDGLVLPREEIVKAAYVLRPLSELAPDGRHPVLNKTFAELWQRFDEQTKQSQRLDAVML